MDKVIDALVEHYDQLDKSVSVNDRIYATVCSYANTYSVSRPEFNKLMRGLGKRIRKRRNPTPKAKDGDQLELRL